MNNNQRKSIHFTSDLHFGHANSIKFDDRPFKDLNHMHRVLINNYNAQVPEDGICYFLGDMGMTSSETLTKILKELNGTKVLILGNHDKGYNAMYGVGFDVVLNSAMLIIANQRVTLSHCPLLRVYREDIVKVPGEMWHGEFKNKDFTVTNEGQFHLHGHIHSTPTNGKLRLDNRQMDVGVAANKYHPVSISDVESWIAKSVKAGI